MPSTSIAMAASLFYLSRYVSGRRITTTFSSAFATQFANHQRQTKKFMSTISPITSNRNALDTEQPSATISIDDEEPFKVNLLTIP